MITVQEFETFLDEMNDGVYVFLVSFIVFGTAGNSFFTRLLYIIAWMLGWAAFSALKLAWKSWRANG